MQVYTYIFRKSVLLYVRCIIYKNDLTQVYLFYNNKT